MTPDPEFLGSELPDLPVLDPDTMEQLLALDDGGLGLLEEMHVLFRDDTPPRLSALDQALEAKNWEWFGDTAHAVKGAASTMGAPRMRRTAQALEHGGRKAHWPEPPENLLAQLKIHFQEALQALEAFIASKRS